VGGLAHYLEEGGIPTTQISLVRENTVAIRPPRALWVPFDFGRPCGAPDEPGLQMRVLRAALALLEAQSGPVLEDFPEDAPAGAAAAVDTEGWACPVSFSAQARELSEDERLLEAFRRESAELQPWYDLSLEHRGRSAVGRFDPRSATAVLGNIAAGQLPDGPVEGFSPAVALRLAAQDLQAFYFEAVAVQPGQTPPTEAQFGDWFWRQTAAGRVLKRIRARAADLGDGELKFTAEWMLVPHSES